MILAAFTILWLNQIAPTADEVRIYTGRNTASVASVDRGARRGTWMTVATRDAIHSPVVVEHEALEPGEVQLFLARPIRRHWQPSRPVLLRVVR